MQSPARFFRPALLLLTLLAAARPDHATAQRGYLFREPQFGAALRLGLGGPVANDDLFTFFTEELTLQRGDFRTLALAGDFSYRLSPKVDFVFGIAMDQSDNASEFEHLWDQDEQPIEQTTTVLRAPITAGVKYYLAPRGRRLSTHAWVPVNFTPYVTAGGGFMFYQVEQEGDFVDYETNEIFTSQFESSGGGPAAFAGVGGEYWFNPGVGLNLDGRYAWGSANLDRDFADFGEIDLQGFQFTAGLAVRF